MTHLSTADVETARRASGIGAACRSFVRFVCCTLAWLAALPFNPAAAIGNQTSPLGINLRELRYWNTEFPSVDFFKRAGSGNNYLWLTQQCQSGCAWNTNEQGLLDLDSSGWPRSLPTTGPATYRIVTTILVMATDKFPAGRWTVFYDGEGTLAYGFDAVAMQRLRCPDAMPSTWRRRMAALASASPRPIHSTPEITCAISG